MPQQLFKPFDIQQTFSLLTRDIHNRALYAEFLGGETPEDLAFITLPPGYAIRRFDNRLQDIPFEHFELVVLNSVTQEVVYYNRVIVQKDSFLNHLPVTQILVWRTPDPRHDAALRGLAGRVFSGYLLGKYNVVITDRHQTQQGQNFWLTRLYDALASNQYVYAYDMISCELRPITAPEEINESVFWLWGDEEHHQNRLAIISVLPLPNN